jgi:SHS2 domain-containing protein
VAGADPVDLLIRWMGEVLYLFEGESLLVTDVRIQHLTSTRLDAEVGLLPFDPKRDDPLHAIKAVTYHQAVITEKDGKWEALVILDV